MKFDKKSVEVFKNKLNSKITEFAKRIDVKNYIEKSEPEDSIDYLLELLSLEDRQIVVYRQLGGHSLSTKNEHMRQLRGHSF